MKKKFLTAYFMFFSFIANAQWTRSNIDTGRRLYPIDSAKMLILTAGSLDFFGNQQFSKYVGQLDIRLPSLFGKSKKWGINTGLFTKNYYTDSVYTGTGTFNVRKPNDTSFYAQKKYNRYAKITYDVFGAYINPTFLLTGNDANLRIYFDLSFEFLATNRKTAFNNYKLIDSVDIHFNSNVKQSNVLDPKDQRIKPNQVITQSFITGFYGLGPQLIYHQDNLMDLNLLSFIGYAVTGYENPSNAPNTFFNEKLNNNRQFYYFFKGVVTERATKLNGTIGVELRGFFPNNTAVAAYLGFLINPSDFFKKSK